MKRIIQYSLLLCFPLTGIPVLLQAEAKEVPPKKWDKMQEKMRRDSEGLKVIRHPDGRISIDLDGRFTHVSALVHDENGQACQHCFENFQAMDKAVRGKSQLKRPTNRTNEVAEK